MIRYFATPFILICFSCSTATEKHQTLNVSETHSIPASMSTENETGENTMFPELARYIQSLLPGMDEIPENRKELLQEVAAYIREKKQSNEPANLTFICTHNSRRSHLSQIWAATAAAYFGLEADTYTYSGGTETTAFNPRAVAAIERAGFRINHGKGDNPRYKVQFSEEGPVIECFSKKYNDPFNPSENFAAIMTCSDADKNCPFIPGASLRLPIPYVDPKAADGTTEEAAVYDERTKQIATEMFYLMSQVES